MCILLKIHVSVQLHRVLLCRTGCVYTHKTLAVYSMTFFLHAVKVWCQIKKYFMFLKVKTFATSVLLQCLVTASRNAAGPSDAQHSTPLFQ